jgi:hypothetical protein
MNVNRRIGALALGFICCVAAGRAAAAESPHRISGPYVHENLAVYLIHGPGQMEGRPFLTLARALDEKKVVVHETGTVSQLAIENVSDSEVYVQAGEIVKGGRQDRVVGTDLLLPPRSGRVPLPSHCVEQGRWQPRGGEAADRFGSSRLSLAHKDLKIANYAGSQQEVWSSVTKVQDRLAKNVNGAVRSAASPSSLALTLGSDQVAQGAQDYVRALGSLLDSHPDAIGFAFAVNGRLNSADAYGSRRLFAELWPKLLQATATEAVAEKGSAAPPRPPAVDAVRAMVTWADEGALTEKAPHERTRTVVRETSSRLAVETRDASGPKWVHRSYVQK